MKKVLKYIAIIVTMSMGIMTTGCVETPEIVESVDLVRCLSPLNLSVKIVDGDNVTFRWDAVKGADQYLLEVYSDEAMTALVDEVLVNSDELPVTLKLVADSEYWFRVKATDSTNKLEPSKWSVYDSSVKTYAVKPTVYPAVADRTESTITVSWDAEAAAGEVDKVQWCVLGSEQVFSRELTEAEINEAKAALTALQAKLSAYNHATALIYYDGVTTAPRGTATNRGQTLSLDELEACIPAAAEDANQLAALLNSFLEDLPDTERRLFVGRYWYAYPVNRMAEAYGMTPNAVSKQLARTREKLKAYLEERGYSV